MEGNGKRKWWVLGSLTFGILAISLDMTILNVALPTLADELQASTGALQWIIDSYTLVLAAILLPAGMLGTDMGAKSFCWQRLSSSDWLPQAALWRILLRN